LQLLIIGAHGQLGQALQITYKEEGHLQLTAWSRHQQDITDPVTVDAICALQPDIVINAAAWTDVDGAESCVDEAYATNMLGPKHIATGCAQCGAKLVHISTNEVFAGQQGRFYREYDSPDPSSVYALSKLAGEHAAQAALDDLWLIRVSWLYGLGDNNFPAKICAAADRHGSLRVVDDEFGNPTYAFDVAAAIQPLITKTPAGIYHLVNSGSTSRYEFARAVLQATGRSHIPITPIPASQWPRRTQPPSHAVLINHAAAAFGITLRPWQDALEDSYKEPWLC